MILSPPVPTTRPALSAYLNAAAALHDENEAMLAIRWRGPGYHTRMPEGARVHEIRGSFDYALGLMEEGGAESVARAARILDRVLPLQDLDPTSPTYGIWPWLLEEPLEHMSPPDWNWADFCGVRLAQLLGLYRERLGAERALRAERALAAAAWSIFRRNVGPGYTNIAFKGALVAGIAGELTDDVTLLRYAERRLEKLLQHIRSNGGFTEYTSPPYGMLMLGEAERGLSLARTPRLRALVAEVHRLCWIDIAGALHVPTGQLCGPLSRTYGDLLTVSQVEGLETRLALPLFRATNLADLPEEIPAYPIPPLPCPADIRASILRDADRAEHFSRQRYVFSETEPKRERTGTRWFGADACIGSANYENFWTQRRPLLAHWRVGDALAVLRVGFRHDGSRDFCSGAIRAHQQGRSIAAICSLVTERGDFHDILDRPADGIFRIADLHVFIALQGPDARVDEIVPGVFSFSSGAWAVLVQPAEAIFAGHRITWRAHNDEHGAMLRAVVDDGAPLVLEPTTVESFAVAFSLSLQPSAEPAPARIATRIADGALTLRAETADGPLEVSAPLKPETL